jgi:hypothetical protein
MPHSNKSSRCRASFLKHGWGSASAVCIEKAKQALDASNLLTRDGDLKQPVSAKRWRLYLWRFDESAGSTEYPREEPELG